MMAGKAIDPEEKIPQGMSAQTLTPTFRKKFRNVKELTNHAMQHWKQELLKPFYEADAKERQREYHGNQHDMKSGLEEKIPQVQDLDAAGKGSPVVEKIPQLGRADRKDREASNQAGKEVFCFRKKFRKQKQTPAMQQARLSA